MCVVSNIGDHYKNSFPNQFPSKPWEILPGQTLPLIPISRDEFERLRKEVEEMKRLLINAKEIDEKTGQKDCEIEDKMKFLKQVAMSVGVDLDTVLKKD